MKIKKIILLITIALSVLSLSLFASCGGDSSSGGGDGKGSVKDSASSGEKISLSVVSKDMIFGDKFDIICFYGGENAVVWSSSDETVAIVDEDGAVSTVGVGNCVITAKAGDSSASCKINGVSIKRSYPMA